jgi:hypothetical protein
MGKGEKRLEKIRIDSGLIREYGVSCDVAMGRVVS